LHSVLSPYGPTKYYFPDFRTFVLTDNIPNADISLIQTSIVEGIIGDIHVRI